MKNLTNWIMLFSIVGAISLTACENKKTEEKKHESDQQEHDSHRDSMKNAHPSGHKGHGGHEAHAAPFSGPVTELYQEVMTIHDEVMPKTGEIMRLQNQLKDKAAQSETTLSESQKEAIHTQITDLEKAYDDMTDWMKSFDHDLDYESDEERIEYLSHEKEKISNIKTSILSAIESASALLKEGA